MISDLQEMIVTWTPRQAGYVETMSHQILLGLDFLHRSDIAHCGKLIQARSNLIITNDRFLSARADLQPGNMLVAVTDSINDTEAFLEPPQFSPVRWLEGVTKDGSAPEYLMPSQRRYNQLKEVQHFSLVVKIGDLGGGNRQIHSYAGCCV